MWLKWRDALYKRQPISIYIGLKHKYYIICIVFQKSLCLRYHHSVFSALCPELAQNHIVGIPDPQSQYKLHFFLQRSNCSRIHSSFPKEMLGPNIKNKIIVSIPLILLFSNYELPMNAGHRKYCTYFENGSSWVELTVISYS